MAPVNLHAIGAGHSSLCASWRTDHPIRCSAYRVHRRCLCRTSTPSAAHCSLAAG